MKINLSNWRIWPNIILDKIANFDYTRLIPKTRREVYPWAVTFVRAELTWKYEGPGVGFALFYWDYWLGYPWKKKEIVR